MKTYCITGIAGALGSVVAKALVARGDRVIGMDNFSRGSLKRLEGVDCQVFHHNVRFEGIPETHRMLNVDCIIHMAAINGTKNFYERPDEVLDVSIRGMLNVLDWCKRYNIPELLFVSSSEVYQEAPTIPTPEDVPLIVPDLFNPRYSYGGGKIAAELLAVHCGQFLKRMMIVRPHNIYGPDMGNDHVIPQLIRKILPYAPKFCKLTKKYVYNTNRELPDYTLSVPIQGTGEETRAFCYIDDFVSGLLTVLHKGENRNVYNIGTEVEWEIDDLVYEIAQVCGVTVSVVCNESMPLGSPSRRCPDTSKLRGLGWTPIISMREGLRKTIWWHRENCNESQGESQTTAEAK